MITPLSKKCWRLASLGMVLVVGTSGCYRYARIESPNPAPGTHVSAELTDVGVAQLGRLLGSGVYVVRGSVVEANDRELSLSVRSVIQRNGVESYWNGENVSLPRQDIASLTERRLSKPRSAALAGAAGAGVALLVKVFVDRASGGSGPGGGGTTPR